MDRIEKNHEALPTELASEQPIDDLPKIIPDVEVLQNQDELPAQDQSTIIPHHRQFEERKFRFIR